MSDETLSAVLEREHLLIDAGIGGFLDALDAGTADAEALVATLGVLRRHIYAEEQLLFPPISKGSHMMAVFGMIRGHGEIWRTMDALEELSQTASDPDRLRTTCHRLQELLTDHNKVEEPVIYPAADTGLSPEQAAELVGFLADGRMPDGWICAKAAA